MVQATINLFAVLGLAPLTGVPLPFVSYGNSSLLVMLAAVGILLNIADGATVPRQRGPERSRPPTAELARGRARSAPKRGRRRTRPASDRASRWRRCETERRRRRPRGRPEEELVQQCQGSR